MSRRHSVSRHRGASRPPLERMIRIHRAIRASGFPNASTLARDLEVSTRSIVRDLEFMRDRLQLPIAYDAAKFGYYYTEEVAAFPTLQMTEGELFAMVVAEKALRQYRHTPFEQPLVSAFRKMAAALPETISVNLAEWDQAISFRTSAEPVVDLEVFNALAKATSRRQQLLITYRKPGQGAPESRRIDPYHLANINGQWFLFAYDHLRQDIRTFATPRIQKVAPTGATFPAPEKFSLEQRLRSSFGVISGEGEFAVVLHFAEPVADYIRERRWHPSQRLIELGNGGVELRLRLSSLLEIRNWVLSWGGSARVVEPPELAAAVREAAAAILGLYR